MFKTDNVAPSASGIGMSGALLLPKKKIVSSFLQREGMHRGTRTLVKSLIVSYPVKF